MTAGMLMNDDLCSPLIAEQFVNQVPTTKVLKNGERVIVDHDLTITRVYMYLYLLLNIGAIIGATSTPLNSLPSLTLSNLKQA